MLLAADKPLPLCEKQAMRTKTVNVEGKNFTITFEAGFAVREHGYYRCTVDDLGLSMKSYQYELELEACEEDLLHLKAYLNEHFAPGEEAELWNLWVGIDRMGAVPHCRGRLSDFDMEALEQFLNPPHPDGGIGQCRVAILI